MVHRFTLHLRHTISPLLTCASTRSKDTCTSGITRGHDSHLNTTHEHWLHTSVPSFVCTSSLSASVQSSSAYSGGREDMSNNASTCGKVFTKEFSAFRLITQVSSLLVDTNGKTIELPS